MANESDNDIVIECSPFADSEIDVINLKPPSYEIQSMPNLFDDEESLTIFISTIMGVFILVFITFMYMCYINYINNKGRGFFGLLVPFLYLSYLGLFVGGVRVLAADLIESGGDKISGEILWTFNFYIILISMAGVIVCRPLSGGVKSPVNLLEGFNILLPGMSFDFGTNLVQFILFCLGIYAIISLFKMSINIENAWDPTGLLTSYCLLQILNYMTIQRVDDNASADNATAVAAHKS